MEGEMADKRILNKLVDLQGTNFEILDVEVNKDEIVWKISHRNKAYYICPNCHKKHKYAYDKAWIIIKDIPLGKKKMIWHVNRARIICKCHYRPLVEFLPFRSIHHRLTQRLVNLIEELLCTKMFTVADVARLFEIDYGIVYKIDHELLWRLIDSINIPHPENISVDEKSFRKGHKYVTVVTDIDSKKVIWVSEGRRKESLDEFFKIIGPEGCKKIKTVAKDLHEPYALSINEYIPHAKIIADKFHVIKKLNETLNECRKELERQSDLNVTRSKKRSEQLQWVLRYKNKKLHPGQLETLNVLQKVNERLYKAYLLKEYFYNIFDFKPSEINEAKDFLLLWIKKAKKYGFIALQEFVKFLERHFRIILNIILFQRTTAVSEGINRKISVIKCMAYGYRNIQYFMLKIMQRCGILGDRDVPISNA